jgi:hypothetical protein
MKIISTLTCLILFSVIAICQPAEFSFTATSTSGIFTGQAQINGSVATAEDWIAAFDSDGNCAGANQIITNSGLAYMNLVIYGDDPSTMEDEGINNESFIIKIWDASENAIISFPNNPTPVEFSDWSNNNGAPIPAYNDPNVIYNFESFQAVSFSSSVSNVDCFGDQNGSIELTITGGSGNFSIAWSNGQNGNPLSNLSAGNYSATIADNDTNETVTIGNIEITSPSQITLTTSSNPEIDGNANGNATVNASGGVPPYAYEWDDQFSQSTATANNLTAGDYEVTVTDDNGCTKLATVEVGFDSGTTPPPNDDCGDAIDLSDLFGQPFNETQTSSTFSNTDATVQNDPTFGQDCFFEGELNNSVWFTFEGDGNTYLIESTGCNSPIEIIDSQFALYSGNNCSDLSSIACNDNINIDIYDYYSTLTVETTTEIYYLLVDGYSGSEGEFCLEVTKLEPNSTKDLIPSADVNVFPNPTNDYLIVEYSGEQILQNPTIELFDISGKKVFQQLENNWNQSQLEIKLDLQAGTYLLKLESEGNLFHQRIIIQ